MARSIGEVGLLHPIVVTPEMRLVAGLHRLRACERLGWTTIPATVLPLKTVHAELAELDENLARNELTVLERAEQLAKLKRPTGRYHVIVVDPPWSYASPTEDYPSIAIGRLKALPIAELAEDDCMLWLWTTNLMMRHALACLDAWGFAEQTILTWVKPCIGKGWYLRNQTEHCIVATRGRPVLSLTNQSTVLHAKARERGRKPDGFYSLVEDLCVGKKLDMFARESRSGWTT